MRRAQAVQAAAIDNIDANGAAPWLSIWKAITSEQVDATRWNERTWERQLNECTVCKYCTILPLQACLEEELNTTTSHLALRVRRSLGTEAFTLRGFPPSE